MIAHAFRALVKYFFASKSFSIAQSTLLITTLIALVTAFIVSANLLLSNLIFVLPTNSYTLAGLSLIPQNAVTCATTLLTAHSVVAIFRIKRQALEIAAKK